MVIAKIKIQCHIIERANGHKKQRTTSNKNSITRANGRGGSVGGGGGDDMVGILLDFIILYAHKHTYTHIFVGFYFYIII